MNNKDDFSEAEERRRKLREKLEGSIEGEKARQKSVVRIAARDA